MTGGMGVAISASAGTAALIFLIAWAIFPVWYPAAGRDIVQGILLVLGFLLTAAYIIWRGLVQTAGTTDILLSPDHPVHGIDEAHNPAGLIDFARSLYDVVLVDTNGPYGLWNKSIARYCDELLLVTTNELPALRSLRDRLLAAGATMLAMPCNTAHHWYDALAGDCPVPFISIVESSCAAVRKVASPGQPVGLIGTRATLAAGIYDRQLQAGGYRLMLPSEEELAQAILPSIRLVKEGRAAQAGELLAPAVQALLGRGAAVVVLACTETPVALDASRSPLRAHCVDSNRALARACVARWSARRA